MMSRYYTLIYTVVDVLLAVVVVFSLGDESKLCQICDWSSPILSNSSKRIQDCYRHGTYDVYCHPDFMVVNGKVSKKVNECESFFSINLPKKPFMNCVINIYDNYGNFQDVITITTNGSIKSSDNFWHSKPQKKPGSSYFGVTKRIISQEYFEGMYLRLLVDHAYPTYSQLDL